MDRLSVLCFAGTYTLALAGELARPVIRGAWRGYATIGLAALGWLVQTAYLANRALRGNEFPVATVFESLLVLSWIVGAIALYLMIRAPATAVGAFVLPLVVVLSVFAGLSRHRTNWAGWEDRVAFWGTVHGLFLLLGAVFTCLAFVAGLMYLVQARRLKLKRPHSGFRLPSLEQTERLNRTAITIAFPLLTCGFLVGVALMLATSRDGAGTIGWTDPKVVSAIGLWLVFAVLLHARFRPAMRGRRVMLLTVVAFAFLIFTWAGVDLLLPTAHGVPGPRSTPGLRP